MCMSLFTLIVVLMVRGHVEHRAQEVLHQYNEGAYYSKCELIGADYSDAPVIVTAVLHFMGSKFTMPCYNKGPHYSHDHIAGQDQDIASF